MVDVGVLAVFGLDGLSTIHSRTEHVVFVGAALALVVAPPAFLPAGFVNSAVDRRSSSSQWWRRRALSYAAGATGGARAAMAGPDKQCHVVGCAWSSLPRRPACEKGILS